MSNEKQVAPPFSVKGAISEKQEDLLATVPPPDGNTVERSETETLSSEKEERPEGGPDESPEGVLVQSGARAIENISEYWQTGRIGGMELGNRSGVNPFAAKQPNPKNPFVEKKAEVPVEEVKLWPQEVLEGRPAWREVVQFVMVHGKDVQAVRYPNAPRSAGMPAGRGWTTVIETTWCGVPVLEGEKCQIQHRVYGWTEWEDCQ